MDNTQSTITKREPKNSENRQKKAGIVAEIAEKVGRAKAMVFTNYTGLTHKQLEGFKREIKKSEAEFAITKNTLLKRSLVDAHVDGTKDQNFDLPTPIESGPTGTMFLYGDVISPLKALAKMIKDFEKPLIKFGILDGKMLTSEDILKLSTLPSREVLLTKLAVSMKSPIAGLHRALQWNMQKFVLTLNAVAQKKQV